MSSPCVASFAAEEDELLKTTYLLRRGRGHRRGNVAVLVDQPYYGVLPALTLLADLAHELLVDQVILEETRETAKRELAALAGDREELEATERDRDLILEAYAALAPETLDALSPEERRKVYVILNLTVEALADGGLQISGAFGEEPVWEDVGTSTR